MHGYTGLTMAVKIQMDSVETQLSRNPLHTEINIQAVPLEVIYHMEFLVIKKNIYFGPLMFDFTGLISRRISHSTDFNDHLIKFSVSF